MQLRSHGGSCCGIRHLSGFGAWGTKVNAGYNSLGRRYETKTRLELFKGFMKQLEGSDFTTNRGAEGKLVEVVVTDSQVRSNPDIPSVLKAYGFKFVTRFNNSSGGMCNVFHKTTGKCGDHEVPSWWTKAKEVRDPIKPRTYFRYPKGHPKGGQFIPRGAVQQAAS